MNVSAPHTKLTGLIALLLTLVQGLSQDSIVAFLVNTVHLSASLAPLVAGLFIVVTGWITANSHAQTGTGGVGSIDDPRADSGIGVNMTTK